MKLAIFSAKSYDKQYIGQVHKAHQADSSHTHVDIIYHNLPLSPQTTSLAKGADAVCAFVNDNLSRPVLEDLHQSGVRAVLLRCAGYNNVDLDAAEELGLQVANVPSYSPEAVAEFAVALIQTSDEFRQLGEYVSLDELLARSDVVSLHCPLMDKTRHMINAETLGKMKQGALLVNTSRGGLIDTKAVIEALKSHKLGGLALDVYEGEGALFYNDHSADIIQDDELMRLMTFPNVVVCGHQAFFTEEALTEIAECTLRNLDDFVNGRECKNSLLCKKTIARRDSIPHRI
ncbi:D-lactate dehydrogenase [Magnaporthiopsis poae ATCC 64411]|uniref:D-lactate dehydrogenase n=1 Tax=Magnaporthiopsis poae (strain ATCC 64411 / 73-15) TaxID=644358 RepID=A0A0C4DU58_MAGP6|nr:D-lactate dehydrogenase [Magnaporthiopsis poae ATCC 64411]